MPLSAWILLLMGPTLIGVLRLATWIARAAGYGANPRPGYIDTTGRKPR